MFFSKEQFFIEDENGEYVNPAVRIPVEILNPVKGRFLGGRSRGYFETKNYQVIYNRKEIEFNKKKDDDENIIEKIKKIERKVEYVQINNILFEYHYISTGKDRIYIHSYDTNSIITIKYNNILSAVFKDEEGNELLRI